jgi:hypothetical protein
VPGPAQGDRAAVRTPRPHGTQYIDPHGILTRPIAPHAPHHPGTGTAAPHAPARALIGC